MRKFKYFEEGRVVKEGAVGHALKVLGQLKQILDKVNTLFPLLQVFSSRLLKDMHWKKIKALTNTEDVSINKMVLSSIEHLQILDKTPQI